VKRKTHITIVACIYKYTSNVEEENQTTLGERPTGSGAKKKKDDTCTRNAGYDRTAGKGSIQNQNRSTEFPSSQPMQKIEERSQLTVLQGFIC
jgi:hypothetical protein